MSRGRRNVHGHIGKDEFLLGLDVGNSVLFVVDVHGRITNNQRERAHIILSETDDRGRNPLVVVENIDWRVGAEGMEPGFIALRSRGTESGAYGVQRVVGKMYIDSFVILTNLVFCSMIGGKSNVNLNWSDYA